MTLDSILKGFPNIRLANANDNRDILAFYHNSQIHAGKQNIFYHRGEDFFKFMKEKSSSFLVFILLSDDDQINGIATVSFREGYIDGLKTSVGYLGDLRINLNRKLIRQWRGMFSSFIEFSPKLKETNYCRYYQTALMDENGHGRNNLIQTKIKNIKYNLVDKYHMVNFFGRIGSCALSKYKTSTLSKNDKEFALSLLEKDQQKRVFGLVLPSEMEYRLKNWQDFSMKDFLVVKDEDNKVLALTYLWAPKDSKKIIIDNLSIFLIFFLTVLKKIPFIHLFSAPSNNKILKIKYIHQLSFSFGLSENEKKNIFLNILDYLFSQKEDLNMYSYCDFAKESIVPKSKLYLKDSKPMGLYSVHFKNNENFIRDDIGPAVISPSFDMSLV